MEVFQAKLRLNYDVLTDAETGIDVNHVTDYLRRDNAVCAEEYEEIHAGSNCRVRAERLIEVLLQKDERAYEFFLEALRANYPHFAQLLDETSVDQSDNTSLHAVQDRRQGIDNVCNSSKTIILPAVSTVFVGRDADRGACLRWLQTFNSCERIYTITGPPGVGKTALVIHCCHEYVRQLHTHSNPHILFFDLRSIKKIEDLAFDILLAMRQSLGRHPLNMVCNLIRNLSSYLVLVLDNAEDAMVEQLKDEFLSFLNKILQANSKTRVIITSRVSVKILAVGTCEARLNPLDESDGVSLASRLVPNLDPNLLKRLCELTGYLPLGLRLLAILLQRESSPEEIVTALEGTPGSTLIAMQNIEGIPSSSQIVSCFKSCFNHLDDTLQNCLIACSIFPTSFDRNAAQVMFQPSVDSERKMACTDLVHTQRILRSLEDRSLLMFDKHSRRYSIHPLLRTFCEQMRQMQSQGWSTQDVQRRYCEYFVRFALNASEMFFVKDSCSMAVHKFWSERQNIELAFQICLANPHLTHLLLGFASRKGIEFLRITIPDKKIRQIYDSLLEALAPEEAGERSMVLTALSFYARVAEHDAVSSLRYIEEASSIQDNMAVSDVEQRTFYMHTKAKCYAHNGRFEEAEEIAKESLKLGNSHPDENVRWFLKGFSVEALAGIHRNQFLQTRDPQKAVDSNNEYNTVLKYLEKFMGNHIFQRYIHMSHGQLRSEVGDLDGALHSLQKALEVQNIVMGGCGDQATVHFLIAEIKEKMDDYTGAAQSLTTAFDLSSKVFGASPQTMKCGRRLIQVLRKLDKSDKADWYENKIAALTSEMPED
ncbi:uncharacterized protein LOC135477544 [Liolophura sinensis]|uniref:uncharacterized protein LOC135477544 n=1 Tax=Liolophura sinensis TaxID=3198878 RepID=UPI0031585CD9